MPRSLQVTQDGKLIVHLNKRRKNDRQIREESNKKVRIAVDAESGERYKVVQGKKVATLKQLQKGRPAFKV